MSVQNCSPEGCDSGASRASNAKAQFLSWPLEAGSKRELVPTDSCIKMSNFTAEITCCETFFNLCTEYLSLTHTDAGIPAGFTGVLIQCNSWTQLPGSNSDAYAKVPDFKKGGGGLEAF